MNKLSSRNDAPQSKSEDMSSGLRLLHVGPLPPPWSGMGVSFQHFLTSTPVGAQANWVINTSRGVLPGNPGRPKIPTPGRIMRHARLAIQVMQTTRQHGVHVVHLHGSSHDLSFLGNWLSVVGARLAGARIVWHLHEDLQVVQFPGRGFSTRTIFSALMLATDALAVLTDKDRRVANALVAPHKVVVLPATCSPEMVTLPLDRVDGNIRVLYVGWLTQAKGIYDLLRVALAVCEYVPGITFYALGTGMSSEETDSVHTFVEQHNLQSQVKLCGVVTGEAKRKIFAEAHLLFMPTHWDAFPVAVLEAMAAGLPVLGTNAGGLPFMLENGRGAFLAKVGDIAQMTDYLVKLAGDRGLRLDMGRANRERFLAFYHPDKVGQAAVDLYMRLVHRVPDTGRQR